MFKDKEYLHLTKNYNNHLYKGLNGYFFKKNHKLMEKGMKNKFSKNCSILEIGPGYHPHLIYLSHKFKNYNVLEMDNSKKIKNFYRKKFPKIKLIKKFERKKYDRIIMSHTLEHINNPNEYLLNLKKHLGKKSILSISLPTDPGMLWRLGRFLSKNRTLKLYDISSYEYDYINAIEHVNSIFNLIILLKKHFKIVNEIYYPFQIKIPDFNLFYVGNFKIK